MRYETTVRYKDKFVKFKVTRKEISGDFELPQFIKAVRESYKSTLEEVHMITDFPVDECKKMENGELVITKAFLNNFAAGYKIPSKIVRIASDDILNENYELTSRLYELRTRANKTQGEIAKEIGVARTTYACYESGQNEPDLKTLLKIAELYKVSLDYLAGRY